MKEKLLKIHKTKTHMTFTTDIDEIKSRLNDINQNYLLSILKEENSYFLLEKFLSFADICNYGKNTSILIPEGEKKDRWSKKNKEIIKKRVSNNILCYNTIDEMEQFELNKRKSISTTRQSCITINDEFCNFLNVPVRDRQGDRRSLSSGKYKAFIMTEGLSDFTKSNTILTINRLNKNSKKVKHKDYNYDKNVDFFQIDLTLVAQGIGASTDEIFQQIRNNAFVQDKMYILLEKDISENYNIYIMFYKNAIFYKINKLPSPTYVLNFLSHESSASDEPSREGQRKWRDQLSEINMALNIENPNHVICPFTGTSINFTTEGTILRASHIKSYKDCKNDLGEINTDEAYDLDNGFLLLADIDALFDKHLISVDPSTLEIKYSKNISSSLKNRLNCKTHIDNKFVSEKKKDYLKIHYEEFKRKNSK